MFYKVSKEAIKIAYLSLGLGLRLNLTVYPFNSSNSLSYCSSSVNTRQALFM